ncbi:MAG: LamG-like jellyroll fold domain-containing protein [Bacteroidia bacterium]
MQYAITKKTLNQNLQKHLVSHLSFDQIKYEKGENATTPDLAKKNKHGTLKSPDIKPGIKGNAFFVTDYNYGRFPEKVGWFERTDPFSMSLWVFPDTLYQKVNLFTHCEELRLGLKDILFIWRIINRNLSFPTPGLKMPLQVTSTQMLPQNQWSMLTITYDGSSKAEGIEIFINGAQERTHY